VRSGEGFVDLDKTVHDRQSFDCGNGELNDFITTKAVNHMKASVSLTRVLPASEPLPNGGYPICAFFSVAASTLQRATLPPSIAKKLPHYPVPVFLVAQLAVNSKCQGTGLGRVTLIKALEYLVEVNRHMRAVAVIVDPVDYRAQRFYEKYGFEVLCQHNDRSRMYLPMGTVVRLFG